MKKFIRQHPLAAVFAFVTVCVLPMIILRDPSPSNELRYLSIVEEALRDGHFFCFYNQGIPYTDKPPLFFWIMMLCRLFCAPASMWLPTLLTALIPSLITVAVMDRWLLLSGGDQALLSSRPERSEVERSPSPLSRLCAAAILLGCLLVMVQTFFLRMDMLMTLFIVLAVFTFWKMYTGAGAQPRDKWLLPLYIFLGLFTKGPVGFFAPVLIIMVFLLLEGNIRRLPQFLGWRQWLAMLLLFGGWILGAYLEGGKEYIGSLLFHQTLDRAVNAFTHKHPFWWYVPTLLYCVLPFTLLMLPALGWLYAKTARGDTYSRLLLTSAAVIFVMLSAFSGKLSIYLTPIIPFAAYLMPGFEQRTAQRAVKAKKAALMVPAAIFAIAGLGLPLIWALHTVEPFRGIALRLALATPYIFCTTILATCLTLGLASVAASIVIARCGWQKGAVALTAAIYLGVFAAGCTIGPLNEFTGYKKAAQAAVAAGGPECEVNTLMVPRPENMDVYLGRDIIDYKEDIDAFVKDSHSGAVLIVPTSLAISDTRLKEFLESREPVTAGEFSIYRL